MRRNRLTLDELLEALRAQGVTSLGDVKYAILETSGQLSVLLRTDCQPATPSQLGLYVRDDVFLPEVIINDGRLLRGNLERLRLDDAWLKKQLRRCRAHSPADVFLLTVDERGSVVCVRKEEVTP